MRLISLLLLAMAFVGCQAQSNQLTADQFEAKLTAIKEKQVLDVRTAEEFAGGHLSGAKQIDFYKDDFKANLAKLDKNKPVFVYCAGGVRSGSAAKILSDMGFKQIYDLKGGIRAWSASGKTITK